MIRRETPMVRFNYCAPPYNDQLGLSKGAKKKGCTIDDIDRHS
jgi:hypothetical protein